jgi:hypothetical protein
MVDRDRDIVWVFGVMTIAAASVVVLAELWL